MRVFDWILRIIAALILAQTLYFKFTGHPESVFIFTRLGGEPYGRVLSGIIELVAAIMLLTPRLVSLGALLSTGVMMMALLSHFFVLGISVHEDGGILFSLAAVTFVCSCIVLFIHRKELPVVGSRL